MSRERSHMDNKRKLFRAITTRISHHNHSTVDKEDDKNSAQTSPYNNSLQNNNNTQSQHNFHSQQMNHHRPDSGQDSIHFNNHVSPQNKMAPVTQGNDSNNFSYLESVSRAPVKKRVELGRSEMVTPILNLKMKNNKTRNALSNTTNTNNKATDIINSDTCSPHIEYSSATAETSSFIKTDSSIINNDTKEDMNEYDYKTFSTNHPLRFSKVKAFEQAEITTKMYFSKFKTESVSSSFNISYSSFKNARHSRYDNTNSKNNNKNNDNSNSIEASDFIIQIPMMSREETRNLLSNDAVESRILENGFLKFNQSNNDNSSNQQQQQQQQNATERRMFLMKNALRPLSKEELVFDKLQSSSLPNMFQNTGDFLGEMDPQEIEFWELMNEEFENDITELQKEYRNLNEENKVLVDRHTVGLTNRSIKRFKKKGRHYPEVEGALSTAIRKRIKEEFQKEDQFTLSTD